MSLPIKSTRKLFAVRSDENRPGQPRRRFRVTRRQAIVAASVVVVLVLAAVLWRRSSQFRDRAAEHAASEDRCTAMRDAQLQSEKDYQAAHAALRASYEKNQKTFLDKMNAVLAQLPQDDREKRAAEIEAEIAKNQRATDEKVKSSAQRTEELSALALAAARTWDRAAAHYRALREKYEHAATQPWWPVAADPPPPSLPLTIGEGDGPTGR